MKLGLALFIILFGNNLFGQVFIEKATEVGINYEFDGIDNQEIGAGVTILDVNNDGWEDVFQSGGIFASKLWLNKKGKFVDATSQYIPDSISRLFIQGAAAGDFDNDGFEDLFICNQGESINKGDHLPPILLKNVNGNYYVPVFQSTFNEIGNYSGCVWGDYNNDGFIDLYVLNYVRIMRKIRDNNKGDKQIIKYDPDCMENKFYINLHGSGFKEVGKELGLNDAGCGLAAAFTDYDNDGDADLILLNDFGSFNHLGNRIFRNEFPVDKFTDMSFELGFYNEFYGMGVGTGDVNNDGWFDYFLTNIGRNYFYLNQKGALIESAEVYHIDDPFARDSIKGTSWSGIFLDLENDGDLDLYVAKGYLESIERVAKLDENRLFLNEMKGEFRNISKGSGINDSLAHRGAASFDFDHDGDLDIISGVIKMRRGDFEGLNQKICLFENIQHSKNKWIGIKLIGDSTINSQAIGASISFRFENGIQSREVDGGSAHSSQSSKTLYFGLGNKRFVEDVEIQWPGGKITTLKKLRSGKVYLVDPSGRIEVLY